MSDQRTVGTYILLSEGTSTTPSATVPDFWQYFRFDTTDVLYICPFQALSDSTLGMPTGTPGDPLGQFANRFNWVVHQARNQNPNIRIIMTMMMQQGGQLIDLNTHAKENTFAASIASFLTQWRDKKYPNESGQAIPGHIDGFDIDVELGNEVERLPHILKKIRQQIDATGHKYYLSICPAWTNCLDKTVPHSVDFINMQNYDGGAYTNPEKYRKVMPDLKDTQLIWGWDPELPSKNNPSVKSVADVLPAAEGLGGIWSWRLNSTNWVFENMAQLDLYCRVKAIELPEGLDELVVNGWAYFSATTGETPPPISPWTEQDWIDHKEWRVSAQ